MYMYMYIRPSYKRSRFLLVKVSAVLTRSSLSHSFLPPLPLDSLSLSLSLLPPPPPFPPPHLVLLQLPSNPHPVFETGDITPEVLENPLKNFPKLKEAEINSAVSESIKARETPSTDGGEGAEKEEEGGGRDKINSDSAITCMR